MDTKLQKIDHIVVLMLENRSFDNLLGWLYDPGNQSPFDQVPRGQPFDGVSGKNLYNPIPEENQEAGRKKVPVGRASALNSPRYDPGEAFPHINTQLFGTIIPPNNRPPFKPPYNLPSELPEKYPMNGFVRDYLAKLKYDQNPTDYEVYKEIMDCYTPEQVPVISHLAHNYAVCDRWFCAVPSQTWTNRSFFHAGSSSRYVNNKPYYKWLFNDSDTIFNRISDKKDPKVTWKVYYDQLNFVSLTLLIHFIKLFNFRKTNFFDLDEFYEDAASGNLPSYSFIEPRFILEENDQHPPGSVTPGEKLIHNIYQALRSGKNWEKTLLVITYDEHGGCYDHVQPPPAACPDKDCPPGEQFFRFDRLGLRVPAVLVSPYIEGGTVFRARDAKNREVPLEHTSILKTITRRFGLEGLTERDKAAADIIQVLTLDQPRADLPVIPSQPEQPSSAEDNPLTEFQKSIIELLSLRLAVTTPALETAKEAVDYIKKVKKYLE